MANAELSIVFSLQLGQFFREPGVAVEHLTQFDEGAHDGVFTSMARSLPEERAPVVLDPIAGRLFVSYHSRQFKSQRVCSKHCLGLSGE